MGDPRIDRCPSCDTPNNREWNPDSCHACGSVFPDSQFRPASSLQTDA